VKMIHASLPVTLKIADRMSSAVVALVTLYPTSRYGCRVAAKFRPPIVVRHAVKTFAASATTTSLWAPNG